MPRRVVLLLVVALAVSVVTSWSTPANPAELGRIAARRTVERSVHEAYPDLAFGNVACPAGIRRARGVSFRCTVQLPGTFLVVDAKQTDGNGTIDLSTQQALIPTQSLRDFISQNASLPATIDCGPGPFRVATAGQTINCATTLADGTARTVTLTVQDTAGNVTLTAVA